MKIQDFTTEELLQELLNRRKEIWLVQWYTPSIIKEMLSDNPRYDNGDEHNILEYMHDSNHHADDVSANLYEDFETFFTDEKPNL